MLRALVLVGAVLLLAGGAAAGWFGGRELDEAETVTETTASTTTETAQSETGLPAAVEETRAELLAAAETGDYEKLRELVPATGFEYTFGGPVEGGAIAYWQELERATIERPIENLAAVLRMPYTLSRGIYVWPFAYDIAERDEIPLGTAKTRIRSALRRLRVALDEHEHRG